MTMYRHSLEQDGLLPDIVQDIYNNVQRWSGVNCVIKAIVQDIHNHVQGWPRKVSVRLYMVWSKYL